ncbi:MAG: hypothetical protein L0Z62_09580 [Gemmataceae bacterium]|nr:hypothetical protein [Gemmataceae bacterium]
MTCPRCRARRPVLATILKVTALVLFLAATVGAAGMFAFIPCPCRMSTFPDHLQREAPKQPPAEPEPVPPPAQLGSPQVSNR